MSRYLLSAGLPKASFDRGGMVMISKGKLLFVPAKSQKPLLSCYFNGYCFFCSFSLQTFVHCA